MKLFKSILLILSLCFFNTVQAQKAEEIIATYLKNTGGSTQWKNISSIQMNTAINFNGLEIPLTIYATSDAKQAMIIRPLGTDITLFATDGKTAWNTNPMTMSVQKLTPEKAAALQKSMAMFPNPFLEYVKKGYTATFEGLYKIKDTKVYKIMLTTSEDNNTTDFYFDTTTYLPIQIEKKTKDKLHRITIEEHTTVDGIKFPSKMTRDGETLEIDTITINPDISETIFQFPN